MERRRNRAHHIKGEISEDDDEAKNYQEALATNSKFRFFMESQQKTARPRYSRNFWDRELSEQRNQRREVTEQDVDKYYAKLKSTRPKPVKEFSAHELHVNEVPVPLFSAAVNHTVRSAPKKMLKVFNESDYYESKQPKLSNALPESFVTKSFHDYLMKTHDRVPETMKGPFLKAKGIPDINTEIYDDYIGDDEDLQKK